MRVLRSSAAACALCVVVASSPAARQTDQVFRQRVELVTVDVTVADARGRAVDMLTADDFHLLVDGAPRPIVAFRRAVRAAPVEGANSHGRATADASLSDRTERVFVLLVDRQHLRPNDGRDFLRAAAGFVDGLGAGDRIGLWTLPSSGVPLDLALDREALKRALRGATGRAAPPPVMHAMTDDEVVAIAAYRNNEVLQEIVVRECSRMANAGPVCEEEIRQEALRRYLEVTTRTNATLASLEELFSRLASYEGPKHVVYITPGPSQTLETLAALRKTAAAAQASRVTVHAFQVPPRAQAVDTERFGRPPPAVRYQDTAAYALADMTGGMAMTPSDPRVAFRQLLGETAAAYELGFEPAPGDRDGAPHRIDVRITGVPGVSVRARRQFVLTESAGTLAGTPDPQARSRTSAAPAHAAAPTIAASRVSLVELLESIGTYVERFEADFSSVVMEEHYVQLVRQAPATLSWPSDEIALEWYEGRGAHPRTGRVFDRRQLLSDVLLVQTREGWFGYRDVAAVDGRPVRRREERVTNLFLSRSAGRADQLRRIAEESARYNLGGFRRTLNLPTLPLSFLHSRHHFRFTFTGAGREQLGDRWTDIVAFEEQSRPTLIGTPAGGDVPLTGRVWVDSDTGEVLQTAVQLQTGGRRGHLLTRYGTAPGFDVLVPVFLWEWYDGERAVFGSTAVQTVVECLARYGTYRRFRVETSEDLVGLER